LGTLFSQERIRALATDRRVEHVVGEVPPLVDGQHLLVGELVAAAEDAAHVDLEPVYVFLKYFRQKKMRKMAQLTQSAEIYTEK
jgi:hypothetical protein